jgi:hypothetical protein
LYDSLINNANGANDMNAGTTIQIDGIKYVVHRATAFEHNGKQRFTLFVKRPAGKRFYYVVQYENGNFSAPV